MRTMAVFVIFSVVVACSMQVFAIDCSAVKLESIRNCNECIRCGGSWCNKGEKNPCTSRTPDNWCIEDNAKEVLPSITKERKRGSTISPSYYAVSTSLGNEPRLSFTLDVPTLDPDDINLNVTIVNTTQSRNYKMEELETDCKNGKCTTHLTISPKDFCLDNGSKYEYLWMKMQVENVTEEATVKYHVPCACSCSDHVIKSAPICNGRGDFSCGVCACHDNWAGEFCTESTCTDRGDVEGCTHIYRDKVLCAGNGECSKCGTCICFEHGEGWQYFDKTRQCADIGLVITLDCDDCLNTDLEDGVCPDCGFLMRPCNSTLLEERDDRNRTVWVQFKDSDGKQYAAKRDAAGQTHIMRISSCTEAGSIIGAGNVNVTIPTVLGVLALVGTVAAVAGYAAWKARSAPVPLSASQYQELDGPENSAGINPLYRSPTSSYNNPLWKAKV